MVNKDLIRAFVTIKGTVIGEDTTSNSENFVKLKHPFLIVPGDDGRVMVGALFMKEEWAIIPQNSCIEVSVNDGMKDMYSDYESKIFDSIIAPPEKRIII